MTWVIGTGVPFGYCVGLSDICVTFDGGLTKDCLQKIYPVGRFVVAGFAGSVQLGFKLVDLLCGLAFDPDPNVAVFPGDLARCFQEPARNIFLNSPPELQDIGSQILLLGVHPTDDLGVPDFPKPEVYTCNWPYFEPVQASVATIVSIGSGSEVDQYKAALQNLSDEPFKLLQLHVGGAGGPSSTVGLNFMITQLLKKYKVEGISTHLHCCFVSRGQMWIGNNDHETYPQQGEKEVFCMPPVATSWQEFLQMASLHDASATLATC
jgi:hypothetical protein